MTPRQSTCSRITSGASSVLGYTWGGITGLASYPWRAAKYVIRSTPGRYITFGAKMASSIVGAAWSGKKIAEFALDLFDAQINKNIDSRSPDYVLDWRIVAVAGTFVTAKFITDFYTRRVKILYPVTKASSGEEKPRSCCIKFTMYTIVGCGVFSAAFAAANTYMNAVRTWQLFPNSEDTSLDIISEESVGGLLAGSNFLAFCVNNLERVIKNAAQFVDGDWEWDAHAMLIGGVYVVGSTIFAYFSMRHTVPTIKPLQKWLNADGTKVTNEKIFCAATLPCAFVTTSFSFVPAIHRMNKGYDLLLLHQDAKEIPAGVKTHKKTIVLKNVNGQVNAYSIVNDEKVVPIEITSAASLAVLNGRFPNDAKSFTEIKYAENRKLIDDIVALYHPEPQIFRVANYVDSFGATAAMVVAFMSTINDVFGVDKNNLIVLIIASLCILKISFPNNFAFNIQGFNDSQEQMKEYDLIIDGVNYDIENPSPRSIHVDTTDAKAAAPAAGTVAIRPGSPSKIGLLGSSAAAAAAASGPSDVLIPLSSSPKTSYGTTQSSSRKG